MYSGYLKIWKQLLVDTLIQKYEMDNRQIENKKKYEQKETRREMMARKRLYLRQLFQKEFIEQEKLLRQIGYALIPTRP
uniref:Uncharacterized protein n=1 Tax=Vespula pensylvanica TaxID=30213 RepID=A0A834U7E3_VESPE|nr:hypothetical protein H0235_010168 [Vespula pensylvanica]